MKSIRILLFAILSLGSWATKAQELQATVTINTEQLQLDQQRGSSQIYSELQRTLQDFLSNRRWSNDNFAPEEKIKLNINLLLTKVPPERFNLYVLAVLLKLTATTTNFLLATSL